MSTKKTRYGSLEFIAFLQAAGLTTYCLLVGLFIWQSPNWFASPVGFAGPALLLILFVASALISAVIVLTYPFWIFWEEKNTRKAFNLIWDTILWLIFFLLLTILLRLWR